MVDQCKLHSVMAIHRIAIKTLSLDLCPDLMGDGVGQASFLQFHVSQHSLPILEVVSVEKLTSR